jgi:hypothetical protein
MRNVGSTGVLGAVCSLALMVGSIVHAQDATMYAEQLGGEDATARANARVELSNLGKDGLVKATDHKIATPNAHMELHSWVVSEWLLKAEPSESDAENVMRTARSEAQAKRYSQAENLYRLAEKLYDTLKDNANDRQQFDKAAEYRQKQARADTLKDKAKIIDEGGTEKVGLNLGIVHIGTTETAVDDGDW